MQLLKSLNRRYATKKFDGTKRVSNDDIALIEEATRLSASSYGFQPYTILKIENPEIRKQLQPFSWGQSQIVDASHLYVFCSYLDFTEEMVNDYVQKKATVQNIPIDKLDGYSAFMKGKLQEISKIDMAHWTAKQAYIALANMLAACGELNIDSCPIEGFEPKEYDKLLGLSDKGLRATVIMTVGYHAKDDHNFNMTKVRRTREELFKVI
ncbi:MAG: nitroreductase/dihydropteridine reductase [Dokdonia sp.]|jgi:nitroreductase/dihydropteridine reductase